MRRHGYMAVAVLALLLGAGASEVAAAGLGYARIAKGTKATGEGPVLAGDRVLVGATRRGRAVVRVVGLDGSAYQVLRVPHAERTVLDMAASEQAVAVITATAVPLSAAGRSSRGVPAAFGPLAGPLRALPTYPDDVAVSGPLVVAFGGHRRDRVLVRDVTAPDAPPREMPVPDHTLLLTGAAGRYLAVLDNRRARPRVVVLDLLDGREIYRVRTRGLQEAAIAPDARVVILERAAGGIRVVTATPAQPTGREIARMALYTPRLAATESGVAVVRRASGGLAQIVIVGYDGTQRPVTPALNGISALDYDGARLAFTAGRCVFAGPIPAGPPGAAPRDPCFVEPAGLDLRRLERIAQTSGRRLRVPLTCTVPPASHCTVRLRLTGPGFTVRRRTTIPPGRHIVHVAIPAVHRTVAWRKGMTLETLERGRPSSGAAIPN